jgi:Domain of unkown function (DUF1775)
MIVAESSADIPRALVRSWPVAAATLPGSRLCSRIAFYRVASSPGVGIGIGVTAAVILPLLGIAQAHVTVQPGTAQGGGFSVVAFRVPNERDDVSTTQVRISLPEDQPIGSVKTTPVALLLSLISTAVAWRRGWRPNSQLEAESATTHEDVNV